MKLFKLLILLLLPLHSWEQATIKEIKQQNPRRTSTYSFPKVILQNKAIANKINNDLVEDVLDIEPGKVKKSIFEKVWGASGTIPSLIDVSYDVKLNSTQLLCLAISGEGCGAYCENFTHYYTYYLKTGARIKLEDILTATGQKFVLDSMKSGKEAEIADQIASIKDSLKVERILSKPDEKQWYEEALEMYGYCLTHTNKYEPELEFMKYYFIEKKMHVIMERCSPHALRAVDDLDDFEFIFEMDKMKPFFTPEFNTKL